MASSSLPLYLFMSLVFLILVVVSQGQVAAPAVVADPAGGGGGGGGGKGELVPAMFIFGDSLIDNGNNNDLPSFAKANYFPYGIDFADGPTGRFCNGLTMVDAMASLLGLPLIPPHSLATGKDILHGLNFASAAAGILDATGGNFVGRIPFNQQIQNFQSSLDQMTANLDADGVGKAISRCIFFIGMGSNDFLNNYLMPNFNTKDQYNVEQFTDLLAHQYNQQLNTLYNLGARRFVISSVGSLGCVPSVLARDPNGRCNEDLDRALVLPFNNKVKAMVNNLNSNLLGAKFVYLDVYRMFMDLIANPRSYGFSNVDTGCCGVGRNKGEITCLPLETPCEDRNQYIFWDAFHPTEAVNVLMAKRAFSGTPDVVFPINVQELARLDLQQQPNELVLELN